MAGYYNPYYDFAKGQKTGSDFLRESGVNTQPSQTIPQMNNPYYPQGEKWVDGNKAIAGGLTAINSGIQGLNSPEAQDYKLSATRALNAGAQGFAAAGPIGAVVGAGLNQIGQGIAISKAVGKVDPTIQGGGVDVYGRPVYNSQGVVTQSQNLRKLRRGLEKKVGNTGNPFTKKKMRNKIEDINTNITGTQEDYNRAAQLYNDQQTTQQQYNQLLNNQARLRNLYSIGTNLY